MLRVEVEVHLPHGHWDGDGGGDEVEGGALNETETTISVAVEPVQAVVGVEVVKRVGMFFSHPTTVPTHQEQVIASINSLDSTTARATAKTGLVLAARKVLHVHVDVASITVVVPHSDTYLSARPCPLLALQLSSLHVSSIPEPPERPLLVHALASSGDLRSALTALGARGVMGGGGIRVFLVPPPPRTAPPMPPAPPVSQPFWPGMAAGGLGASGMWAGSGGSSSMGGAGSAGEGGSEGACEVPLVEEFSIHLHLLLCALSGDPATTKAVVQGSIPHISILLSLPNLRLLLSVLSSLTPPSTAVPSKPAHQPTAAILFPPATSSPQTPPPAHPAPNPSTNPLPASGPIAVPHRLQQGGVGGALGAGRRGIAGEVGSGGGARSGSGGLTSTPSWSDMLQTILQRDAAKVPQHMLASPELEDSALHLLLQQQQQREGGEVEEGAANEGGSSSADGKAATGGGGLSRVHSRKVAVATGMDVLTGTPIADMGMAVGKITVRLDISTSATESRGFSSKRGRAGQGRGAAGEGASGAHVITLEATGLDVRLVQRLLEERVYATLHQLQLTDSSRPPSCPTHHIIRTHFPPPPKPTLRSPAPATSYAPTTASPPHSILSPSLSFQPAPSPQLWLSPQMPLGFSTQAAPSAPHALFSRVLSAPSLPACLSFSSLPMPAIPTGGQAGPAMQLRQSSAALGTGQSSAADSRSNGGWQGGENAALGTEASAGMSGSDPTPEAAAAVEASAGSCVVQVEVCLKSASLTAASRDSTSLSFHLSSLHLTAFQPTLLALLAFASSLSAPTPPSPSAALPGSGSGKRHYSQGREGGSGLMGAHPSADLTLFESPSSSFSSAASSPFSSPPATADALLPPAVLPAGAPGRSPQRSRERLAVGQQGIKRRARAVFEKVSGDDAADAAAASAAAAGGAASHNGGTGSRTDSSLPPAPTHGPSSHMILHPSDNSPAMGSTELIVDGRVTGLVVRVMEEGNEAAQGGVQGGEEGVHAMEGRRDLEGRGQVVEVATASLGEAVLQADVKHVMGQSEPAMWTCTGCISGFEVWGPVGGGGRYVPRLATGAASSAPPDTPQLQQGQQQQQQQQVIVGSVWAPGARPGTITFAAHGAHTGASGGGGSGAGAMLHVDVAVSRLLLVVSEPFTEGIVGHVTRYLPPPSLSAGPTHGGAGDRGERASAPSRAPHGGEGGQGEQRQHTGVTAATSPSEPPYITPSARSPLFMTPISPSPSPSPSRYPTTRARAARTATASPATTRASPSPLRGGIAVRGWVAGEGRIEGTSQTSPLGVKGRGKRERGEGEIIGGLGSGSGEGDSWSGAQFFSPVGDSPLRWGVVEEGVEGEGEEEEKGEAGQGNVRVEGAVRVEGCEIVVIPLGHPQSLLQPSATSQVQPSATSQVQPSATSQVQPSATSQVQPRAADRNTPATTSGQWVGHPCLIIELPLITARLPCHVTCWDWSSSCTIMWLDGREEQGSRGIGGVSCGGEREGGGERTGWQEGEGEDDKWEAAEVRVEGLRVSMATGRLRPLHDAVSGGGACDAGEEGGVAGWVGERVGVVQQVDVVLHVALPQPAGRTQPGAAVQEAAEGVGPEAHPVGSEAGSGMEETAGQAAAVRNPHEWMRVMVQVPTVQLVVMEHSPVREADLLASSIAALLALIPPQPPPQQPSPPIALRFHLHQLRLHLTRGTTSPSSPSSYLPFTASLPQPISHPSRILSPCFRLPPGPLFALLSIDHLRCAATLQPSGQSVKATWQSIALWGSLPSAPVPSQQCGSAAASSASRQAAPPAAFAREETTAAAAAAEAPAGGFSAAGAWAGPAADVPGAVQEFLRVAVPLLVVEREIHSSVHRDPAHTHLSPYLALSISSSPPLPSSPVPHTTAAPPSPALSPSPLQSPHPHPHPLPSPSLRSQASPSTPATMAVAATSPGHVQAVPQSSTQAIHVHVQLPSPTLWAFLPAWSFLASLLAGKAPGSGATGGAEAPGDGRAGGAGEAGVRGKHASGRGRGIGRGGGAEGQAGMMGLGLEECGGSGVHGDMDGVVHAALDEGVRGSGMLADGSDDTCSGGGVAAAAPHVHVKMHAVVKVDGVTLVLPGQTVSQRTSQGALQLQQHRGAGSSSAVQQCSPGVRNSIEGCSALVLRVRAVYSQVRASVLPSSGLSRAVLSAGLHSVDLSCVRGLGMEHSGGDDGDGGRSADGAADLVSSDPLSLPPASLSASVLPPRPSPFSLRLSCFLPPPPDARRTPLPTTAPAPAPAPASASTASSAPSVRLPPPPSALLRLLQLAGLQLRLTAVAGQPGSTAGMGVEGLDDGAVAVEEEEGGRGRAREGRLADAGRDAARTGEGGSTDSGGGDGGGSALGMICLKDLVVVERREQENVGEIREDGFVTAEHSDEGRRAPAAPEVPPQPAAAAAAAAAASASLGASPFTLHATSAFATHLCLGRVHARCSPESLHFLTTFQLPGQAASGAGSLEGSGRGTTQQRQQQGSAAALQSSSKEGGSSGSAACDAVVFVGVESMVAELAESDDDCDPLFHLSLSATAGHALACLPSGHLHASLASTLALHYLNQDKVSGHQPPSTILFSLQFDRQALATLPHASSTSHVSAGPLSHLSYLRCPPISPLLPPSLSPPSQAASEPLCEPWPLQLSASLHSLSSLTNPESASVSALPLTLPSTSSSPSSTALTSLALTSSHPLNLNFTPSLLEAACITATLFSNPQAHHVSSHYWVENHTGVTLNLWFGDDSPDFTSAAAAPSAAPSAAEGAVSPPTPPHITVPVGACMPLSLSSRLPLPRTRSPSLGATAPSNAQPTIQGQAGRHGRGSSRGRAASFTGSTAAAGMGEMGGRQLWVRVGVDGSDSVCRPLLLEGGMRLAFPVSYAAGKTGSRVQGTVMLEVVREGRRHRLVLRSLVSVFNASHTPLLLQARHSHRPDLPVQDVGLCGAKSTLHLPLHLTSSTSLQWRPAQGPWAWSEETRLDDALLAPAAATISCTGTSSSGASGNSDSSCSSGVVPLLTRSASLSSVSTPGIAASLDLLPPSLFCLSLTSTQSPLPLSSPPPAPTHGPIPRTPVTSPPHGSTSPALRPHSPPLTSTSPHHPSSPPHTIRRISSSSADAATIAAAAAIQAAALLANPASMTAASRGATSPPATSPAYPLSRIGSAASIGCPSPALAPSAAAVDGRQAGGRRDRGGGEAWWAAVGEGEGERRERGGGGEAAAGVGEGMAWEQQLCLAAPLVLKNLLLTPVTVTLICTEQHILLPTTITIPPGSSVEVFDFAAHHALHASLLIPGFHESPPLLLPAPPAASTTNGRPGGQKRGGRGKTGEEGRGEEWQQHKEEELLLTRLAGPPVSLHLLHSHRPASASRCLRVLTPLTIVNATDLPLSLSDAHLQATPSAHLFLPPHPALLSSDTLVAATSASLPTAMVASGVPLVAGGSAATGGLMGGLADVLSGSSRGASAGGADGRADSHTPAATDTGAAGKGTEGRTEGRGGGREEEKRQGVAPQAPMALFTPAPPAPALEADSAAPGATAGLHPTQPALVLRVGGAAAAAGLGAGDMRSLTVTPPSAVPLWSQMSLSGWSAAFPVEPAGGVAEVLVPQSGGSSGGGAAGGGGGGGGGGAFALSLTCCDTLGESAGRAKTITLRPRYVVANSLAADIRVKQHGTDRHTLIKAGGNAPIHFTKLQRRLYLSLRLADSSCEWSGAFRPSQLGDTQLKLRCSSSSASSTSSPLALTHIVRVDVSLAEPHLPQAAATAASTAATRTDSTASTATIGASSIDSGRRRDSSGGSGGSCGSSGAEASGGGKWSGGGTYLVVVGEDDSGFMPFRIDNCCREVLRFYQRGCEGLGHTDSLKPFAATPYAWDEPCRPHRLVLEVPGEGGSMGHFPLDQVKHFPLVVLPATPQREQRRLRVSVSAQGPIRVLSVCDIDLFPPPSSLHPLRHKHSTMTRHAELASSQHYQPWHPTSKSIGPRSPSSPLELRLSVCIPLLALSIIDNRPQELLLLSLHRLSVSFTRSPHQHSLSFLLSHLQLDNQLQNALFPVLLASSSPPPSLTHSPSPSPFSASHPSPPTPSLSLLQAALQTPSVLLSSVLFHTAPQQGPSHSALQGGQAAVELEVVAWRQRVGSVLCVERVAVSLAPLSLEVEEHVLLRLLDFSRACIPTLSPLNAPAPSSPPHASSAALPGKDLGGGQAERARGGGGQGGEGARGVGGAGVGRSCGDAEDREEGGQQGHREVRMYVWCSGASVAAVGVVGGQGLDVTRHVRGAANMYIESMSVHPLRATISFASAPWASDQTRGTAAQGVLGAVGAVVQRSVLALADVQGAPLGLSAWQLEHFFGGPQSLAARLERHYTLQLLQALYKVVGSADFLGNPVGLLSSVSTSLWDLLASPTHTLLMRRSPAGFARGVWAGWKSLLRTTLFALSHSASRMSHAASKGMASLAWDEEDEESMEQARQPWASHASDEASFFASLIQGVTGLLDRPIRGWERGGLPGLASGLTQGVLGVVARPAASALALAAATAESIRNVARPPGPSQALRPLRLPRQVGTGRPLAPYCHTQAAAQAALAEGAGGAWRDEDALACFQVVPEPPASASSSASTSVAPEEAFVIVTPTHMLHVWRVAAGGRHGRSQRASQWQVAWAVPLRDVIGCCSMQPLDSHVLHERGRTAEAGDAAATDSSAPSHAATPHPAASISPAPHAPLSMLPPTATSLPPAKLLPETTAVDGGHTRAEAAAVEASAASTVVVMELPAEGTARASLHGRTLQLSTAKVAHDFIQLMNATTAKGQNMG
ncbi:hypothetical protein CLOM_g16080 [Closterium sp. NIES-68]|nr:hypothetical protein CLOM_g16080 [Closterium sp. NIES-68]